MVTNKQNNAMGKVVVNGKSLNKINVLYYYIMHAIKSVPDND